MTRKIPSFNLHDPEANSLLFTITGDKALNDSSIHLTSTTCADVFVKELYRTFFNSSQNNSQAVVAFKLMETFMTMVRESGELEVQEYKTGQHNRMPFVYTNTKPIGQDYDLQVEIDFWENEFYFNKNFNRPDQEQFILNFADFTYDLYVEDPDHIDPDTFSLD
jgi:hypothetical protein